MKKEFSLYLDLMRFLAALAVVIYHSNLRLISDSMVPLSGHGHAAVIVFFVLSGFVISYVTAEREKTAVEYWASRLSRFYSLVLPVVLLTPLLDLAGEALAPAFYEGRTTHDLAWFRILTSLAYLNEVWSISIMSFSNVPFWSLCYEMWYYVMFAIFTFVPGKPRWVLLAGCALLLGPKILVLAPIWVLGVLLQRGSFLQRLTPGAGALLFLASWVAYALFQHFHLTQLGSDMLRRLVGDYWHKQAAFSQYFMTDYLLALIVAANFAGARAAAPLWGGWLRRAERPIRWLAGYTFSLYIMHQPLLQFWAAVFNGDPAGRSFYLLVLGATLVTVLVAGALTEHKREGLRQWLRRRLQALTASGWWQRGIRPVLGFKRAQG